MSIIKDTVIEMPDIGDVVQACDDRLIVTGTICISTSVKKYPYFAGVTENALEDYFRIVDKIRVRSAQDFTIRAQDEFREIMDGKDNDREKKSLWLLNPFLEKGEVKLGSYDFGVSQKHKEALTGSYALNTPFNVKGSCYIVDGHFLAKKDGKIVVMTAFYNPHATKRVHQYMVVPMEQILPLSPARRYKERRLEFRPWP